MPKRRNSKAGKTPAKPKEAAVPTARASSSRLYPLLIIGVLLVGVALGLRSSPWMREAGLRGKGLPELEEAVRQDPNDPIAQYYLAKHYYLDHRFSEACTSYKAAARLDPNQARTHLGLGLSLVEAGRLQEAKEELNRALALDRRLVWAEYTLGRIAWLEGDRPGSLDRIKRAAALDPRNAQIWYSLARCYIMNGIKDKALAAVEQAVTHAPGDARYHTLMAELLVFENNTPEGRRECERALQIDPNYGKACALMGHLCLSAPGDSLDRAHELLERATHLPTDHPHDVYMDLGQVCLRQRQYAQALSALQEAVRIDPRDERPYYALAQVQRKLGNNKAAQSAETRFEQISRRHVTAMNMETRLREVPGDVATHLKLARLYAELGMTTEAMRHYQECRRLQPDSAELSREVERFRHQEAAQTALSDLSRDLAASPSP